MSFKISIVKKKEHQIWSETKYDEYKYYKHIFSFEKQLQFEGKIILDEIFFDSDEARKTFEELDEPDELKENKKNKIKCVVYDNEKHELWKHKNFYCHDEIEYIEFEYMLIVENIYVVCYNTKIKDIELWT